jgi:type IV pilus assembly protein PilX
MNRMTITSGRQQGAALVVGLVLLIVLTILAVSGVFSATMEMRMAGNTQLQERAFQAAELAIEEALANPTITTTDPAEEQAPTNHPNSPGDQYSYTLRWVCTTPVPGWSAGSALGYHFQVDATGTAPGNALAEHFQTFFVLGPPGYEDCLEEPIP